MAFDGRGPRVSGLGAWPRWRATWQHAGWVTPGSNAAVGWLGRLAAQEREKAFLFNLPLYSI
jgi:hypothetical protein